MASVRFIVSSIALAASTLSGSGQAVAVANNDTSVNAPPSTNATLATSALRTSSSCCSALSSILPQKVFTPGGSQYQQLLGSYWSQQEQQVQPACIVLPESAADVSVAITLLSAASASPQISGCQFAVKSGGHTPFAGAANIQGGVTIDLAKLNAVDVAPGKTQVSVGPGNTWSDVYLKLDALGLIVVGGRASSVGVGGLTLGGGFSYFSPTHGLVCDNVVNFEVVLASGTIANVNATSNPRLFKALKGGSGNFGIVTRFDMKAYEQGNFWGGFVIQNISSRQDQFSYFESFASSAHYDRSATIISSYAFSAATGWLIANEFEYTKPEPYPDVFSNFTNIKPQILNTMRISNLSDFSTELGARTPPGLRQSFSTVTFRNSAVMQEKFFDLANETILSPQFQLATVQGLAFSLAFQPEPQPILAPLATQDSTFQGDGNSLGLSAADGDLVNALIVVTWASPADDERVRQATQHLSAQVEAFAKQHGFYHPYLYLNYAADWQDPLQGYGQESLSFLQSVAAEVDPKNLFQKIAKGGFRLAAASHSDDSTTPVSTTGDNTDTSGTYSGTPGGISPIVNQEGAQGTAVSGPIPTPAPGGAVANNSSSTGQSPAVYGSSTGTKTRRSMRSAWRNLSLLLRRRG